MESPGKKRVPDCECPLLVNGDGKQFAIQIDCPMPRAVPRNRALKRAREARI